MENQDVKLGMKVVPHSKSYARELERSTEWNNAIKSNQGFLFVNYIHNSRTFGNVFVLGKDEIQVPNSGIGDFFTASDFEPFE